MRRIELLQTSLLCRVQFANAHHTTDPTHGSAASMEHRLTRYELELMDVLWELGEGSVQEVCDKLERPWRTQPS